MQTPAWHVSVSVHASLSSHAVPFVFGVATQLLVSPSVAHVPVLQASSRAPQSLSLLQRTAFTHSDGEEAGDDDGYEQTSMSSGVPLEKSPCFTQHWAWVSRAVQLVPLQTLPLPCVRTSATLLATHVDANVMAAAPPQFSAFMLSHE